MNKLGKYTTAELIQAFEFYLKGPKENTQLVALLHEIGRELLHESRTGYDGQIDEALEEFYKTFGEFVELYPKE